MAMYFESLGLEDIIEDENATEMLINNVIQTGKQYEGYYGNLYFIQNYGTAEFIVKMMKPEKENEPYSIVGIDTHTQGKCVWRTLLSGPGDVTPKDANVMEKRVMISTAEKGTGMAIVDLVNADVLPSFMEDDNVEMQVVGLATMIEYFKDEQEYAESIPEPEIGKKMLLAEGSICPSGFLNNRNPESDEFEAHPEHDAINIVRGIVTGLYYGTFDLNESTDEEHDKSKVIRPYLRCIVDTQFGPLEIVHTIDQVDEKYRDNMRVGATVFAAVVLSGDVAIYNYGNGIKCDEETDLRLIRDAFSNGYSERIACRIADDCAYTSQTARKELTGKEGILKHMIYVDEHVNQIYCYMATLDESQSDGELDYHKGKRCLILAYDDPDNLETILFLDYDENNLITKFTLTADSRYLFKIDQPPERKTFEPADDEEVIRPRTYKDRMLARAGFHDMIDWDSADEIPLDETEKYEDYRETAVQLLKEVSNREFADAKALTEAYEEAFAKAFVKAAGIDIQDGSLFSQEAFDLSRYFYKDFSFSYDKNDINEDFFKEDMVEALVCVQIIGKEFTLYRQREGKQ